MIEETTVVKKADVVPVVPTSTATTTTTTTSDRLPDTTVGGVSVRGWLVVILTVTVCGISAYNAINTGNLAIEEPLYSGFMIALGYYFGQKK